MSVYFKQELANLKGFGIEVSDLTPEEIVELVHSADKMRRPFSRLNLDAIGCPIEVAEGVCFWRLTIGASVWLDEYAKRWWFETNRHKAYYWAIVYALRHGREPNAFAEMRNEERAFQLIKADAIKLPVTEAELNDAIDEALQIGGFADKKAPAFQSQTDWESVLIRLETQTGIPASKWVWDYPADYAIKAYRDLNHFAALYSGGGKDLPRMRDELDVATTSLAHTRARIIERVKKEKAK